MRRLSEVTWRGHVTERAVHLPLLWVALLTPHSASQKSAVLFPFP